MSSDSDFDENASDQQSEGEENGGEKEASTSNEIANGDESEKPVSWTDLVCTLEIFFCE